MVSIHPQSESKVNGSRPPQAQDCVLKELKSAYRSLEVQARKAVELANFEDRAQVIADIRAQLDQLARQTGKISRSEPETFLDAYDLAAVVGLKIETILESVEN